MYEEYLKILEKKLSEKRYIHSLNVAKEAKSLAQRFGENPEKAYLAGLLHDILKDTHTDMLLKIADEFGIILDNVEKNAAKLLHARVGCEYLKNILGIDDPDIFNAVKYHTTGRMGMTLFEKLIFVADFISEDRTYDGVEKIRECAYRDLDSAVKEGLTFTVSELVSLNKPIHINTIEAYNEAVS
ncbi:MAG: bis(5'-nucleosyl)-tetraphosphatase (symmetrical) YqeK [bacterium]|nr:bis(5'-nucleosyl)-tetraphosphatase (symmetrical) YqeK [bacterium]